MPNPKFWSAAEFEPKKSYKYSVSFSNLAAPFLIKSAKLPAMEISTIEADYLQYKYYYPGKASWTPVEFTIYDVIGDLSVAKKLKTLFESVDMKFPANSSNKSTFSKKALTDALGNVIIGQLDAAGTQISTWTLINPIITGVDYGQQGYSDEALLEVTVTVQYDWALYDSV